MRRPRHMTGIILAALSALWSGTACAEIPASRQAELMHLLVQDCGSCHGMQLTGALGPPLTREALADKPVDSLAATIYQGRPGTPMPGWRGMLSEAEAVWIAEQLVNGFPQEWRAAR